MYAPRSIVAEDEMHKLFNRVVGLKAVHVEIVSQASDGMWILLELLRNLYLSLPLPSSTFLGP